MVKPYRSIDFNNERKWKSTQLNDDVLQVGIKKAIGYVLSNSEVKFKENVYGCDLKELEASLKQRGLLTAFKQRELITPFIKDNQSRAVLTSLWAGDLKMIQKIINKNIKLIKENNFPTDAISFFNLIISDNDKTGHEKNKKIYHVICAMFNSWCLWCEPRSIKNKDMCSKIQFLSSNLYDPDNS